MSGCRTLEDVKAGKGGVELHSAQKIGLQHYDGSYVCAQEVPLMSKFFITDINDRMPRDEARTIFDMIERIGQWSSDHLIRNLLNYHVAALRLDPKLSIDIMGSYRRSVCIVPRRRHTRSDFEFKWKSRLRRY